MQNELIEMIKALLNEAVLQDPFDDEEGRQLLERGKQLVENAKSLLTPAPADACTCRPDLSTEWCRLFVNPSCLIHGKRR